MEITLDLEVGENSFESYLWHIQLCDLRQSPYLWALVQFPHLSNEGYNIWIPTSLLFFRSKWDECKALSFYYFLYKSQLFFFLCSCLSFVFSLSSLSDVSFPIGVSAFSYLPFYAPPVSTKSDNMTDFLSYFWSSFLCLCLSFLPLSFSLCLCSVWGGVMRKRDMSCTAWSQRTELWPLDGSL